MQTNPSKLSKIKNPKGLVNSLVKLHQMVGMGKVKDSIAKQTAYLITKLEQGDFNMKMLNTVIMSGPGMGKTRIGIILAEIWHHLGFLEQSTKNHNTLLSQLSHYDPEMLKVYGLLIFISLSQVYKSVISPLYERFGIQVFIYITIAAAVFLYLLFNHHEQLFATSTNDSYITITSRSDFIGAYLGSTDKKTEDLLRANIGKVVFIDEAYSLYSGSQDMYGMECLTSLNKFMSEHENQIVIIFAGYEDALKNTIFKAQKGLARRCMWHFKLDEYSMEELFDIFQLQLKKENLAINKAEYYKVYDYFVERGDAFPYAGGDVEKLVFFCQLNKNSRLDSTAYISYKDVKEGIKELLLNNQKVEEDEKKSEFGDYLQKLKDMY